MKDFTPRLRRELASAKENLDKYISRPGIEYARGAYNLDQGIQAKREFAVEWRKAVLNLASGRAIIDRPLCARPLSDVHCQYVRKYRVFLADGHDILAVYAPGGIYHLDRLVEIAYPLTAELVLTSKGYKIVGGSHATSVDV